MRVGVLALQGDFARHARALERAGAEAVEVRRPEALDDVAGLILPGGESTTLLRLLEEDGFVTALRAFHAAGRALFGTCAGLILLAREVAHPAQPSLGLLDVTVERNAYGAQRESFEAAGRVRLGEEEASLEMVFIRAPRIRRLGPGVTVLGALQGDPVLVQEGSVLGAAFHPELTASDAVHRYFCRMVAAG